MIDGYFKFIVNLLLAHNPLFRPLLVKFNKLIAIIQRMNGITTAHMFLMNENVGNLFQKKLKFFSRCKKA